MAPWCSMSESVNFFGGQHLERINFHFSVVTFGAADVYATGNVIRNTWIAKAIDEELVREMTQPAPNNIGHAANAQLL